MQNKQFFFWKHGFLKGGEGGGPTIGKSSQKIPLFFLDVAPYCTLCKNTFPKTWDLSTGISTCLDSGSKSYLTSSHQKFLIDDGYLPLTLMRQNNLENLNCMKFKKILCCRRWMLSETACKANAFGMTYLGEIENYKIPKKM